MNPPRSFTGVYSSFLLYVMLGVFGFFSLMFLAVSVVKPLFIIPFIVTLLFSGLIWLIHRNHIRSITFFEDQVVVVFILFKKEYVSYANLQKFSIKYEGFNNKTISTLQYRTQKGKLKSVDFRTQNLNHQQFKSELIQLKKSQPN